MLGRREGEPEMTTRTLSGSRPPQPVAPPLAREDAVDRLHRYLSDGFCSECSQLLKSRIVGLASSGTFDNIQMPNQSNSESKLSSEPAIDSLNLSTPSSKSFSSLVVSGHLSSSSVNSSRTPDSSSVARSGRGGSHPSPMSVQSKRFERGSEDGEVDDDDLVGGEMASNGHDMSREQRETTRFSLVGRKKDFVLFEWLDGRKVNVLEGLELHTRVFSAKEQKKIVDCVYSLRNLGRKGELRERTYSEPKKWMRGKGRQTIQFGCCYNYAVDKNGNPPGIIRDEEVDPLPPLFKSMIRRMVRWHVLPPSCIPNSCIVNIYDEGDCIPPHIDHHDFVRPFCTVSFVAECNILFGSNLKIVAPGEFSGPFAIPLPVGSVLILNGNGADVAKHCVPGVPAKRISITFRKMDHSKLPFKFLPDLELQNIQPLTHQSSKFPTQQNRVQNPPHISSVQRAEDSQDKNRSQLQVVKERNDSSFFLAQDDFPPLGGPNLAGRSSSKSNRPIRQ